MNIMGFPFNEYPISKSGLHTMKLSNIFGKGGKKVYMQRCGHFSPLNMPYQNRNTPNMPSNVVYLFLCSLISLTSRKHKVKKGTISYEECEP